MPPQESESDGHYGKWKMEDCNLGTTRVSRVCQSGSDFRRLAETIFSESDSLVRTYCRQAAGNCRLAACAPQSKDRKGNAGSRFTRDPAFSRCAVSSSKD